jgi:hypothetical protein
VVRSLGIFWLGVWGEGRVARVVERVHAFGIDDDSRAALTLFVC